MVWSVRVALLLSLLQWAGLVPTALAQTAPKLSVSPSSLSFSSTPSGTTSAPKSITLKNSGGGSLQISGVAIGGSNAAEFAASNTCSAALSTNASCSISVSFRPTTIGARVATLQIQTSLGQTSIALKGTGAAPPQPAIKVSPTSLSFPSTTTGTKSSGLTLKVANTGKAPLQVSSVMISNSQEFSAVQTCSTSPVAPAGTCEITVFFTPSATGSRTGSLIIKSNTADRTVNLKGAGAAPPLPAMSISPTSLSFPSTPTGTKSSARILKVTNTGKAPLKVSSVMVSNSQEFSAVQTCSTASIAPAGACEITVFFTPSTTGSRTGSLVIKSNIADRAVSLKGTGATPPQPAITVSPTSLTFPSTASGTASALQTVTVKNTGNELLQVSTITIAGANPADFPSSNTCRAALAPNATCAISVIFRPLTTGARSATVEIKGNAPTQTIELRGTGVTPSQSAITLTPTSLTFPSTTTNSASPPQTITIKNTGTAPLAISGVSLLGFDARHFTQTNSCRTPLSTNSTCSISLAFKPTSLGVKRASLVIRHNAIGTQSIVSVTGSASGVPSIALSVFALNFPAQAVNSSGVAQSIKVSNTGNAALNVNAITLAGADASQFEQTNNCSTVAVDGSCSINVVFRPTSVGAKSASLSISHNASGGRSAVTLSAGTNPVGNTQPIRGSAFKGLIRGATVEVCEVGAPSSRCVSGNTDAKGGYNLSIHDYRGAPVTVVVRGGGGAFAKCDVFPECGAVLFGDLIPLPVNFSLRASVPQLSASNAWVPVTPFTDIVSQLGGSTAQGIRNAANYVGNLLGNVDVLTLTPNDITGRDETSGESNDYALFLSGVAAAVPDNPSSAIDRLREAFSTGSISGRAYSELVRSALDQSQKLFIREQAGLLTTAKVIADASGGGSAAVQLPAPSGSTEIAVAKSTVAAVREFLNEGASLERPFQGVADDLLSVGSGIENIAPALEILFEAVDDVSARLPDLLGNSGCKKSSITESWLTLTCVTLDESTKVSMSGSNGDASIKGFSVTIPTKILPLLLEGSDESQVPSGAIPLSVRLDDVSVFDSKRQKVSLKIDSGTIDVSVSKPLRLGAIDNQSIASAISSFSIDLAATLESGDQRLRGAFKLQLSNVSCSSALVSAQTRADCDFAIGLNLLSFSGEVARGVSKFETSFVLEPKGQSIVVTSGSKGSKIETLGKLTLEVKPSGRDLTGVSTVLVVDLEDALNDARSIEDVAGSVRLTVFLSPTRLLTARLVNQRLTSGGPATSKLFFRANSLSELRLGGSWESGFSGGVYFGEKLVATVSRSNRAYIVRYSDGSFESLY